MNETQDESLLAFDSSDDILLGILSSILGNIAE
jgi:hypothetical protein